MSDKFVFAIDCDGDTLSSGFIGEDKAVHEWASFSVNDLVAGESAPTDMLFARLGKRLQVFEGRVAAISIATCVSSTCVVVTCVTYHFFGSSGL